jgi:hypothetical protein
MKQLNASKIAKYMQEKEYQLSLIKRQVDANDILFRAGLVDRFCRLDISNIYLKNAKTLKEVGRLRNQIKKLFPAASDFEFFRMPSLTEYVTLCWSCFNPSIVISLETDVHNDPTIKQGGACKYVKKKERYTHYELECDKEGD